MGSGLSLLLGEKGCDVAYYDLGTLACVTNTAITS